MRFWITASVVFLLDRLSKLFFLEYLADGLSRPVIPGIFSFSLVLNTGGVFGLGRGNPALFLFLTLFISFIIIYLFLSGKVRQRARQFCLGLILGGALGNAWDRFCYGAVTDFLDFRFWPVFNLADTCITSGALILLWLNLRPVRK